MIPSVTMAITVTNDSTINQGMFCEFLDKIAGRYTDTGCPVTLILDNARYQKKCQSVADKAVELGIELLYLPPYSPNLNLIERLWRFVKKEILYSTHYDKFAAFRKQHRYLYRQSGYPFQGEYANFNDYEIPTVF